MASSADGLRRSSTTSNPRLLLTRLSHVAPAPAPRKRGRLRVAAAAVTACASLVGCGGEAARPTVPDQPANRDPVVPDVTGTRLDLAHDELDELGMKHEEIGAGGGPLTIADTSKWVVCDQRPQAGRPAADLEGRPVYLKVARTGGCASPTH